MDNEPINQESPAVPEIKAAQDGKSESKAKMRASSGKTPVRLLYDTWDAEGARVPAGAVVDLPVEAAKQLLKEHKAERADPFPGGEPA